MPLPATQRMRWRERLRRTAALWPYMVPLAAVYFAEYAMQARVRRMHGQGIQRDMQWCWSSERKGSLLPCSAAWHGPLSSTGSWSSTAQCSRVGPMCIMQSN